MSTSSMEDSPPGSEDMARLRSVENQLPGKITHIGEQDVQAMISSDKQDQRSYATTLPATHPVEPVEGHHHRAIVTLPSYLFQPVIQPDAALPSSTTHDPAPNIIQTTASCPVRTSPLPIACVSSTNDLLVPAKAKQDAVGCGFSQFIRHKLLRRKKRVDARSLQQPSGSARVHNDEQGSAIDHGEPEPVPGFTYPRVIERGLPTGETEAERVQHVMQRIFERHIRIEVPLQNGDRKTIVARAWLDWFCPCNLVRPQILEILPPLDYQSTERVCYAQTPAGPAYSTGRFEGRWFCEDIDVFDSTYDPIAFEILDRDIRCDAIIGRPAIIKHNLFKVEPSMPLAAPHGFHYQHIQVDRNNVRTAEEAARQARQNEARQMQQAATYMQQRHSYAHEQAHGYVTMAYDSMYRSRYQQAAAEFDRLRHGT